MSTDEYPSSKVHGQPIFTGIYQHPTGEWSWSCSQVGNAGNVQGWVIHTIFTSRRLWMVPAIFTKVESKHAQQWGFKPC